MQYTIKPDILVVDNFNRPVVVIQTAKNYSLEDEWAQNTAKEYAETLGAKYAMVVTARDIYLWRAPAPNGSPEQEWIIDSTELLAPLFAELQFDPRTVSRDGFEDLVSLWVNDIGRLIRFGEPLPKSLEWLSATGVDEYIGTGYAKQEVQFEAVR